MELQRRRAMSEVLKRGYSDDEVRGIYDLGRFFLENGDLKRAEILFLGLAEVSPEFAPAWLGLAYVRVFNKDWDGVIAAARAGLRIEPRSAEALLFLSAALMTQGDLSAAGTHLGEVGDLIQSGAVEDPIVVKFYRAQLARYQSRS